MTSPKPQMPTSGLTEKLEQQVRELHLYGCGCPDGNAAPCLLMEQELRAAIREALDQEWNDGYAEGVEDELERARR